MQIVRSSEELALARGGLAGTLATSNVVAANDRIRIGIIGPGDRGREILQQALAIENVECAGAADIYTKALDAVRAIAPGWSASRNLWA